MRNIAIVGGIKTGKSSLVDALLSENPNIHRISMANYGIRIPMTLITQGYPDLLELPKPEYIKTILANQEIPLIEIKGKRREIYTFKTDVREKYGPTIMAETTLQALHSGVQNLVDHVAGVNDALSFKRQGFYIVGLYCNFDAKLRRCLRGKDIDPRDRSRLEALQSHIVASDLYLEANKTIQLANAIYDTSRISTEYCQEIAREILKAARKRPKRP